MVRLIDAEHLIQKAEQENKDGALEDDELEIIYYELSDEPTVDAIPIEFITEFKEDYCNAKSGKCDIGIANALVELMLCWEDEQEGLEWRNDHERIPSKQQSVDAIPIEWIEAQIEEAGYSGYDMHAYELATMLEEWKEKGKREE